jgi:hypothetical protein
MHDPVCVTHFFGLVEDVLRRRSHIELAAIFATFGNTSVNFGPDCTEAYVTFLSSQSSRDSIQDSKASCPDAARLKQKSYQGTQTNAKVAAGELCTSCVWMDSKTGSAASPGAIVTSGTSTGPRISGTLSSIAVNVSLPMNIIVEKCQGRNAIFINGVYTLRNAQYGKHHLLFLFQSESFGTMLGCLVQKNRVSCAISATAVKVYVQSKDQSCLLPFSFPCDWTLLETCSPTKPAARIAPGAPAMQFNVGFNVGAHPQHAGAVPILPGGPHAPLTSDRSLGAVSSTTASVKNQPSIDCSGMTIHDAESSPVQTSIVHVWPSLQGIADVLKNCAIVNKQPLLSHIWRHLVHRCGSSASALTDLDMIFHLSSESSVSLSGIQDISAFLSASVEDSLSDYVNAVGDCALGDWRNIPIAIPASVASFLRTRYNSLMQPLLEKMYHSIFDLLSSRNIRGLISATSAANQTNVQLYVEVAKIVGAPFGLDAADTLLVVNPFASSSAFVESVICTWDVTFCSHRHQDGQRQEPFSFSGATVRFPSGPVHCPTLEQFGEGLKKKGSLNFQYFSNSNDAWSVGLVPVASLHNSSYLWNHSASVIGYSFGGHGSALRQFPLPFQSLPAVNVFVGLDTQSGICSFYVNGNLISSDSVPDSMFPCVIAVCGHSGRFVAVAAFAFLYSVH